LDGKIIAPTDFKVWGRGLFQWLQFTKLMGLTIQGNGIIDGRGSVWWQVSSFDDTIDHEFKLLIPLNSSVQEKPPAPVTDYHTPHYGIYKFSAAFSLNSY